MDNKVIWYQMYEKLLKDEDSLKSFCQLMWNVAMEDCHPQDVKEFIAEELGIDLELD